MTLKDDDAPEVADDGAPAQPLDDPARSDAPAQMRATRRDVFSRRVAAGRAGARAWWGASPDNLRGSAFMLAAFIAFAVMTASIKAIGQALPLSQVLVIRHVVMIALLAPLFLPNLSAGFETRHLGLNFARGLFTLGSMYLGFTALVHVPLADVTALGFSQVLFVTVAAVFVLKEAVGPRRWIATVVGFLGVVVMMRPGEDGLDVYALFAVGGALFGAATTISVRLMAERENTATILLFQSVLLISALLPPAIAWWTPPTGREWLLLLLIGVFGTAGQYLITRAYQVGEASALAPLDFVRLLIACAVGYVLFAETPDATSLVGAFMVVGATVYTMRRNAARNVALPPAATPAP